MNTPKTISQNRPGNPVSISVILPVYNGGNYLKLSVESVLSQQFTEFELLIIDDCSTDGSFDYLQSIQDSRLSLFRNEQNRGLFFNLNFLISQSKSFLIKLWAQDDIMYPNCLGSFVTFHEQYPGFGFSYSGRDMIDEEGQIKENNRIDSTPTIISTALHAKIAYYTGSIAGNIANVCISKKALDEVGLFNENMKISADFDMWVRLAKNHETGFIREKLIQLRDHDKQLSRDEKFYINHVREDLKIYRYLDSYVSEEQRKEGHQRMRKSKLLFYYTLMIKSFSKGNFKTAKEYFKLINSYDSFFLITLNFVNGKILHRKNND